MESSTHAALGVALAVLTGGCFSDPPAGTETTDGTSSSTSTPTPTPTSVAPTSAVPPTTAETGGSSTSSAESDSSSGVGTLSTSGSSGLDSSSGSETTGKTTGVVDCSETRVEVEGVCLTPVNLTNAYTVLGNAAPFDDVAPCLALSCNADLPLGGGFERQNILLHSMQADLDTATWENCGSPDPEGSPNTWNVGARCTVGTGDIFTASEVFSLDANQLPCITVGCPDGTELVGGGGDWGPGFEMTASQPMLEDEEWQVCGGVGNSDVDVEVHAYCAVLPVGASTEVYETIELVEVLDLVCAEAVCPAGFAIAGGGDGNAISVTFETSRPTNVGNAWRACGRSEMFNGQIGSRVVCYQP